MLFGQGTTDSLFPLQQGLANWKHAITAEARRHSIFVGYNGGHVLPAVFPQRRRRHLRPVQRASWPAAPSSTCRVRFFDEQLKGRAHRAAAATAGSTSPPPTAPARRSARSAADTTYDVGTVATTETGGAPARLQDRRTARSGSPGRRTSPATLTALGANNRAFYGLAIGTSPADAHLVQDNVLPINELAPVTASARRIDAARRSRSTCPRGSRSTCSPARSATRSSAWAAGPPAPSCSRTPSRTCPSWAAEAAGQAASDRHADHRDGGDRGEALLAAGCADRLAR